jgi:hypothetical protein
MAGATDFRALFKALEVMQGAPDKASMDQANAWLQDFQHSVNLFRRSVDSLGRSNGILAMATSSE